MPEKFGGENLEPLPMPTPEEIKIEEEVKEKEKSIDLNIVTLYTLPSVDMAIEKLEEISKEGKIDTAVLMEFNFTVDEIIKDLDKLVDFAKNNQTDIVLAPDNRRKNLDWGQLKKELQESKIAIEEENVPDDDKPESVGLFIRKDGFVYAFPKSWKQKPIHKIPDTNIAVTICGEIGTIRPEDIENLEGVDIIYNPSLEGDDGDLKFRILQKYGEKPLTKETIAEMLVKTGQCENPDISDDELQKYIETNIKNYHENLMKVGLSREEADLIIQKENTDAEFYRQERRSHLDYVVQKIFEELSLKELDSPYIEEIKQKLKEKNILVVRSDRNTSGILNDLPKLKLSNLKSEFDYMSFHADLEK